MGRIHIQFWFFVKNGKGKSRKILPETQLSQCPSLPAQQYPHCLAHEAISRTDDTMFNSFQHRLRGQHKAHSEHQSNLSNATFPHNSVKTQPDLVGQQDHHTSTHSSTHTAHTTSHAARICWQSTHTHLRRSCTVLGVQPVTRLKCCASLSLCKSRGAQSALHTLQLLPFHAQLEWCPPYGMVNVPSLLM